LFDAAQKNIDFLTNVLFTACIASYRTQLTMV
jgi:hypothetical protein